MMRLKIGASIRRRMSVRYRKANNKRWNRQRKNRSSLDGRLAGQQDRRRQRGDPRLLQSLLKPSVRVLNPISREGPSLTPVAAQWLFQVILPRWPVTLYTVETLRSLMRGPRENKAESGLACHLFYST